MGRAAGSTRHWSAAHIGLTLQTSALSFPRATAKYKKAPDTSGGHFYLRRRAQALLVEEVAAGGTKVTPRVHAVAIVVFGPESVGPIGCRITHLNLLSRHVADAHYTMLLYIYTAQTHRATVTESDA